LEGQYDAVYIVAQRVVQGIFTQFIERLDDRVVFPYGAEDAWAVDCGLRSPLPTPVATLVPSAASGAGVIFNASSPVFGAALAGDVIRAGGGIATITAVNSSQQVVGTLTSPILRTLPNDPNNTPIPAVAGTWTLTRPSTTFTGLDHLEGQTVSILADGNVVAPQAVVNGAITLAQPATKVVAGLGFQPQLQTMPLDTGNEKDSVQAKRKKIPAVSMKVFNTRGLSIGRTFNTLVPVKEMSPSVPLGATIPLVTGDERVNVDPLWDVPGQICIQQDNPLPATVLGLVYEYVVGDTKAPA
jgi:hypothetical protein